MLEEFKNFLIELEKDFIDEKKDRQIIIDKFLKKLEEVFNETKKVDDK
jgi:hypothetical protein